MKRKPVILVCVLLTVFAFVSIAIAGEFWASKKSNKYHYPTCRWAKKIASQNLIKFSSPEEAQKAGYVPCKVCKPPVSSSQSSIADFDELLLARRGCCSHHKGVYGCDEETDRIRCCDGTLSPTCRCSDY